jgi:predicted hotdog family 3-hydroxylacyl-ACP dehydratase
MIDKAAIAALIPHAGSMCLLDEVRAWDAKSIRCLATSHRDPANPLASDGHLGAACGVEYAAQAMAVHGGLSGAVGQRPKAGYLVSLRALTLHRQRLDDLDGDLEIEAEMLAGQGAQMSYGFRLTCRGEPVLEGRAAVLLEAAA